jgi:hypothetical protein
MQVYSCASALLRGLDLEPAALPSYATTPRFHNVFAGVGIMNTCAGLWNDPFFGLGDLLIM